MEDKVRGKVISLTAVVEYPDGSQKSANIDPSGLDAIYFTELAMDDAVRQEFVTMPDWRQNPTFIERRGEEILRKCKINQCPQPS